MMLSIAVVSLTILLIPMVAENMQYFKSLETYSGNQIKVSVDSGIYMEIVSESSVNIEAVSKHAFDFVDNGRNAKTLAPFSYVYNGDDFIFKSENITGEWELSCCKQVDITLTSDKPMQVTTSTEENRLGFTIFLAVLLVFVLICLLLYNYARKILKDQDEL